MEKEKQNSVKQAPVNDTIIRPTETVEFIMSPIGQQLKTMEMNQRLARTYSMSNIVPDRFQGDKGLANCYIAVDMAMRLGANPLLVMQNLYVVHGNPGWSAKFLIATFNQCGRFTSIRFEEKGKKGQDDWGMRAYAYELTDKKRENPIYGPWIDIALAKAEDWYNKNPKWKNIPEQMLRYRSAAWFVNTVAPEISMGINTVDEIEDTKTVEDAEYEELPQNTIQEAAFESDVSEDNNTSSNNAVASTTDAQKTEPSEIAEKAKNPQSLFA